ALETTVGWLSARRKRQEQVAQGHCEGAFEMKKIVTGALAAAISLVLVPGMATAQDRSSARKQQEQGTAQIPQCTQNLGTIAIVEPEYQWWREYNLGSPEAVLRVFVQRSGCFTLVNRGRSLQSRAMERALAESGEL